MDPFDYELESLNTMMVRQLGNTAHLKKFDSIPTFMNLIDFWVFYKTVSLFKTEFSPTIQMIKYINEKLKLIEYAAGAIFNIPELQFRNIIKQYNDGKQISIPVKNPDWIIKKRSNEYLELCKRKELFGGHVETAQRNVTSYYEYSDNHYYV